MDGLYEKRLSWRQQSVLHLFQTITGKQMQCWKLVGLLCAQYFDELLKTFKRGFVLLILILSFTGT